MTGDPRRRAFVSVTPRLLAWVVACLLVVGCGGADTSHYSALLDELHLPASWQLVHTTLKTFGGPDKRVDPSRSQDDIACGLVECPSVTRYFLAEGQPVDIYPEVRQSALDAGFAIGTETRPKCDLPPEGAACGLDATKGADRLQIDLYNPGDWADGMGVADAGTSVVRIIAAQGK